MKNYNPTISIQLAAGSTASPFFLDVVIRQKLCRKACADETPVFAPVFAVTGTEEVADGQYIISISVQGVIHYTPCGGGACSTRAMTVSETFSVPYAGATAPASVTISAGTTENTILTEPCHDCGDILLSRTPITLTVA